MQEEDIINKIIKIDDTRLQCVTCQQEIVCKQNDSLRKIQQHFYSKKHVLIITQQYLKLLQAQKEAEHIKIFIDWKYAQSLKEISLEQYENFLVKSTNGILNLFQGVDQLTSSTYAKKIKKILQYLGSKQQYTVQIDTALEYLQLNCFERDYVIVKKLLKIIGLHLSSKQNQEIQKQIDTKKDSRQISTNLFKRCSSQILSDLEKLKYLEACFMYLLAFYGITVKQITQSTLKQLKELCKTEKMFDKSDTNICLYNQSHSFQRLIYKLINESRKNEEEPILDLQSIRIQLKEQSQDAEYQEFLERASLQAFSSANKKLKKKVAQEIIEQKEVNTFSFIGSSIADDNSNENYEELLNFTHDQKQTSNLNSEYLPNFQREAYQIQNEIQHQCFNKASIQSNQIRFTEDEKLHCEGSFDSDETNTIIEGSKEMPLKVSYLCYLAQRKIALSESKLKQIRAYNLSSYNNRSNGQF